MEVLWVDGGRNKSPLERFQRFERSTGQRWSTTSSQVCYSPPRAALRASLPLALCARPPLAFAPRTTLDTVGCYATNAEISDHVRNRTTNLVKHDRTGARYTIEINEL